MRDFFDVKQFDSYREDNRREIKRAKSGLPVSLWETYSSFANCYGGVIILGVAENKDGSWKVAGLKVADKEKLLREFWNTINDRKKVNINLLRDGDVKAYDINGDLIIVIYVPRDDLNGETIRGYRNRHWMRKGGESDPRNKSSCCCNSGVFK